MAPGTRARDTGGMQHEAIDEQIVALDKELGFMALARKHRHAVAVAENLAMGHPPGEIARAIVHEELDQDAFLRLFVTTFLPDDEETPAPAR